MVPMVGAAPTRTLKDILKEEYSRSVTQLKKPPKSSKPKSNIGRIRFLCTTKVAKEVVGSDCGGDEVISWNRRYVDSVRWARDKFYELLDKGYKAYSVDEEGKAADLISEFAPEAEEIIMVSAVVAG